MAAGARVPVDLVYLRMRRQVREAGSVLQWVRENDTMGEVWNNVRCYAGGPRKHEVLTWLDKLSDP